MKTPKLPRGCKGRKYPLTTAQSADAASKGGATFCDLFLDKPTHKSDLQRKLMVADLVRRLADLGYSHAAITHTIYGKPKEGVDNADVALPESLLSISEAEDPNDTAKQNKKQKQKAKSNEKKGGGSKSLSIAKDSNPRTAPVKILRRLHAIVENVSDLAAYSPNSNVEKLLRQYDVVSIAPRNDAVFQSVCASPSLAKLVTLDYGKLKLPYRIRSSDVRAWGGAFEVPYGPAVARPEFRRGFVHACHELLSAGGLGKVAVGSGVRMTSDGDVDAGAAALRSPGDVMNVLQVVGNVGSAVSRASMSTVSFSVLGVDVGGGVKETIWEGAGDEHSVEEDGEEDGDENGDGAARVSVDAQTSMEKKKKSRVRKASSSEALEDGHGLISTKKRRKQKKKKSGLSEDSIDNKSDGGGGDGFISML